MKTKIELFVKDIKKSLEFYKTLFDFKIIKENEDYIGMESGEVRLSINTISSLPEDHYYMPEIKNQRLGVGAEIIFIVDNLDSVYDLAKSKYSIKEEIKIQSWGSKDFRIIDPDGYYIRITE